MHCPSLGKDTRPRVFLEVSDAYSLAHWKYSVPYFQCFKIFEMPLPACCPGHLPFGVVYGLSADSNMVSAQWHTER